MDTNPSGRQPVGDPAGGPDTTAPYGSPGTTAADAPSSAGPHDAPPYGPFAAPAPPRPSGTHGFFAGIRRTGLARDDDRWIGGVCAGLAHRFGLDPLLVRGLFAVTVLLGGLGLVVYGVAWALLPERRDGRIHLEETIAGRFDVALLGAIAFALVGLGRGDRWFWFWGGPPGWVQGMLWLAFVVGGVTLVVVAVSRRQGAGPRNPNPGSQHHGAPYGGHHGGPQAWAAPAAAYPAAGASTPYGPFTPPRPPAASAYPVGPPPSAAGPRPAYPSTAYPSTTHASTAYPGTAYPYVSPTPPPPPVPPVGPAGGPPPPPPRRRPSGPGVTTVGAVVALSLITVAVLLLVERAGHFDGPVLLTALGVFVVLAGLGIIVSGLRGRKSGVLGFLAVVAMVVALPVGASGDATSWWWSRNGHRAVTGETFTAPDRATAERGFELGFGDATVDLRDVPLTADTLDVPVSLGAGNLTILVPSDGAVAAQVRAGAGSITWDVDGDRQNASGVALGTRTFTDSESRDGRPQLHLDVRIGAGDILITEEDR